MKKEYLILVVLIAALSAYLVFKKDNLQNYTLPEPMAIEKGKIDKILITQKETPIELIKEDQTWVVTHKKLTGKKFAADMTSVNHMLDVVRNLTISALISESQDLIRYELDNDHAVEVKAFKGKDLLASFKIGKIAPSANHTFVMLEGDTHIYQANKSFKNNFDTSVDMLMDKQVMTFKEDSIKQITLEKDGISKILTPIKAADDNDKMGDNDKSPVSWQFQDKTTPDKEALTNLLSSLSFLTCERFSDGLSKEELEKELPLCTIRIENTTPIVLELFDQNNGEFLVGTSSMNPYSFVLDSYKGKDILAYVDTLAGLVKKEIDKE